jgi:hypothetical protein
MDDFRLTTRPEIADSFPEQTERKGLRKVFQKVGSFATRLGQGLCGLTASRDLEGLTEAQLRELGISRSARRERWIDGSETHLASQYLYRIRSDD